jgi:hypothetical protein
VCVGGGVNEEQEEWGQAKPTSPSPLAATAASLKPWRGGSRRSDGAVVVHRRRG